MTKVRRALPSEAGKLSELEEGSATAAGWGVAGFEAEFRQSGALILAAECGGSICGFLCARLLAPEVQVLDLVVRAQSRRSGVASALLVELFSSARSSGCSTATLEVRRSNEAAIACYGKAGFKIVGSRPKFYNGTEDALLMDAPVL